MSGVAYRPDIDGLRALAVMPVVLNHAGIPGFSGGFVGVDIFFVISGFLITGILAREIGEGRFSIVGFYERRARRILPALFLVLATCLIGGWFLFFPDRYEMLARSTGATLLFASNIWFWSEAMNYFGDGVQFDPLLHTWSLAVEEQFYLGFPLLLWLLTAQRRSVWIAVIAAISVASFVLSVRITHSMPMANFFLTPTRVWELGIGALLAVGAAPAVRSRGLVEGVGIAGLVLILCSILLYSEETPFPGLAALPPCLGAAAIIWAGSQGPSAAGRLLSLPPVLGIGLISYSLYLWHWPVLVAARVRYGSIDLPVLQAFLCIALSILAAWLSWRFVERPFRASPRSGGMTRGRIFAFSGFGAGALVAASVALLIVDGVPSRIPTEVVQRTDEARTRSVHDDNCRSWPRGEEPCRLGVEPPDGAHVEVVVWGDSHAGAVLAGVDAWLTEAGLTGTAFVKAACPPLRGVVRVDRGPRHRCDRYNERVAEYIDSHPGIRTVILAARWAEAVEGTLMPGEDGPQAILAASGSTATGPEGNADLVAQGLRDLLGPLEDRGLDVLIVRSVPEIGFNVPFALAGTAAFGARLPTPPTRAEFDARNARANRILQEVAREFGAELADVADLLCQPRCRIELDGVPLYRDDDHLSTFGARWVMPQLLNRHVRASLD